MMRLLIHLVLLLMLSPLSSLAETTSLLDEFLDIPWGTSYEEFVNTVIQDYGATLKPLKLVSFRAENWVAYSLKIEPVLTQWGYPVHISAYFDKDTLCYSNVVFHFSSPTLLPHTLQEALPMFGELYDHLFAQFGSPTKACLFANLAVPAQNAVRLSLPLNGQSVDLVAFKRGLEKLRDFPSTEVLFEKNRLTFSKLLSIDETSYSLSIEAISPTIESTPSPWDILEIFSFDQIDALIASPPPTVTLAPF